MRMSLRARSRRRFPRSASYFLRLAGECDGFDSRGYTSESSEYSAIAASNSRVTIARVQGRGNILSEEQERGFSLVSALKKCSQSRDLEVGKRLHSQAVVNELVSNPFVASSLITMYARCGSMTDARKVFDSCSCRDRACWNALIKGYVDQGDTKMALDVFETMEAPDSATYSAVLRACAHSVSMAGATGDRKLKWLEKGKAIHLRAVQDCCCNNMVESTLVNMYAKCGSMVDARCVFSKMEKPDVVVWSSLIWGYVDNGDSELALELFDGMENAGLCSCAPNAVTYAAALTACSNLVSRSSKKWLEKAKLIYLQAMKTGCCNKYVETAMLNVYARDGSMVEAKKLFDKMVDRGRVPWNSLLQGYVDNGQSQVALDLFFSMDEAECGFAPDSRTYLAAITACGSLGRSLGRGVSSSEWIEKGKAIHSRTIIDGCCNVYVHSALVSMYAEFGSMMHAQSVFDQDKFENNTVCWNTLIQGYADNGESKLALKLIAYMDANGVGQDFATFVAALSACGNLMAFETGKAWHAEICNWGLQQDPVVGNSLVEFYSKCGNMVAARQVFDSISEKNILLWNNLMSGYSLQGDTAQVFELFEEMKARRSSRLINEVTFVCVLAACSHAGLVGKGKEYFSLMQLQHGIQPGLKHYSCMVDLLSRANRMEEAMQLLHNMPMQPDSVIWTTILGACHKWKNVTLAKVAFEALQKLEGVSPQGCVLMSNVYGGTIQDES